jgi:glycosyltransferase involved in cell wall biosynthesis
VRVAYVLATSAGGTERHVRMLADGLARRGVTVTVYGPAGTRAASGTVAVGDAAAAGDASSGGRQEAPGLLGFAAVQIAERPRPARDLAAVRRLRALFAAFRPDVVHAHGLRAGALAALAVGRDRTAPDRTAPDRAAPDRTAPDRAAPDRTADDPAADGRVGRARARPRLVVTVHNAAPAAGPAAAAYRVLERIVARRADAVLCVSADLESAMRRLGARRVTRAVVPAPPASPAVSAQALAGVRAGLGIAGGEERVPLVLTVARLVPQKGLGTLVEAAGRWRDRDPAPLLVIAGEGPLLAGLARGAEAAGARVRFLGRRDDVPALLAAADVVVAPSAWEGQPLVVQEALRAARPLVASRVGGIPDLTGQDAALLVPPGDAAALSTAVLSVLDDPALSARLSQAAARRSAALPTEQDAVDVALAAYRRD